MLIKALWMALSTYSAIPVPPTRWDAPAAKYAICFFPAVGCLCGAALGAWLLLCQALSLGAVLYAAGAAALPLVITGGIHMDGYMDTVDALASWQPREKKLEIMKDPHCGSFAVMFCGAYLLVSCGIFSELYQRGLAVCAVCGYVLSRALSGLCAVNFPHATKAGMLSAFTAHIRRQHVHIILALTAVGACAGMLAPNPPAGAVGALFALLWMWGYHRMTAKHFGGVTGDTSGFFLQICELLLPLGVLLGGLLI